MNLLSKKAAQVIFCFFFAVFFIIPLFSYADYGCGGAGRCFLSSCPMTCVSGGTCYYDSSPSCALFWECRYDYRDTTQASCSNSCEPLGNNLYFYERWNVCSIAGWICNESVDYCGRWNSSSPSQGQCCGPGCSTSLGCYAADYNIFCKRTCSDYCDGTKLAEYDNDCVQDSINLYGDCRSCTCYDIPSCALQPTITHCCPGRCGAQCAPGQTQACCCGTVCDGTQNCQADCSWGSCSGACSSLNGWFDMGTRDCCDGNQTCTCQREEYRTHYCSGSSCTYTITDSRETITGGCTQCDDSDGWFNIGSVYECCDGNQKCTCQNRDYRDYLCSAGVCTYTVTQRDVLQTNCSNCDDSDGWTNVGSPAPCCDVNEACTCQQRENRDYGCSSGACTYVVVGNDVLQTNCSVCSVFQHCFAGFCTDYKKRGESCGTAGEVCQSGLSCTGGICCLGDATVPAGQICYCDSECSSLECVEGRCLFRQAFQNPFLFIVSFLKQLIPYFYIMAGILAVLLILIAAYFFLTSGGDEKKTKTAKKIIFWTLIILAGILFSRGILDAISKLIESFI